MGMDGDGWDGISKMDGRYFGFLDTYLNLKQRLYLSKKWTRASWAGWALAGLVGRGGRGEGERGGRGGGRVVTSRADSDGNQARKKKKSIGIFMVYFLIVYITDVQIYAIKQIQIVTNRYRLDTGQLPGHSG